MPELSEISKLSITETTGDNMKDALSYGSNFYTDNENDKLPLIRSKISSSGRATLRKPSVEYLSTSNLAGKSGICRCRTMSNPIRKMRIWVRNYSLLNDGTITGMQISACGAVADDAQSPWTPISLDGGLVVPFGQTSAEQGTTVYPGEICTEWFVPPKKSRTDGGTDNLFDVLFYVDDTTELLSKTMDFGDVLGWYNTFGDLSQTPPASQGLAGYVGSPIWLEVIYEINENHDKKPMFLINGDSIHAGVGPTIGDPSFLQSGIYANGCDVMSVSIPGNVALSSWGDADRFLPYTDCEYIIMQAWSINDEVKDNGMTPEEAIPLALDRRDNLEKKGYKVFLTGPFPVPSAYEETARDARDLLIASECDFYDPMLVTTTDPDVSAEWLSGYSDDGYHPNDTATTALASDFETWLSSRF